jgi:hypothetical protein
MYGFDSGPFREDRVFYQRILKNITPFWRKYGTGISRNKTFWY